MLLFSMDAFYAFNIVFLVIGPLSAIGLIAWVILASKQHIGKFIACFLELNVHPPLAPESVSVTSDHSKMAKLKLTVKALAGWERFWIALVVAVLVHVGLIAGFVHLNPYVSQMLIQSTSKHPSHLPRICRSSTHTHTQCSPPSSPYPSSPSSSHSKHCTTCSPQHSSRKSSP